MDSRIGSQELRHLRQSMLLGLARHPLAPQSLLAELIATAPPGRNPALCVLALAGQQQRFLRPTPDADAELVPEAAKLLHQDPRPILPEGARRALRRLASGLERGAADTVLRAAMRRIARAGWRLHPFDLPRLAAHLRDDAEHLGLAERAYLSLADRSGKAPAHNVLHAEISPQNWHDFPKRQRVVFVDGLRRQDPAAGRALIEEAFKSEPADMRGALIDTLAAGLGPDDLAFLEAAAADRAEGVRTAASRLIARVPGTPGFAARLAEAARCFAGGGTGLSKLLKRAGLAPTADVTFTPPRAANRGERVAQLRALFEGLSAADLAATTGLSIAQLLAALPVDDDTVFTILLASARREGRGDLVGQMIEHKLSHAAAGSFPLPVELTALAGQIVEPLGLAFAERLLGSPGWHAVLHRLSETNGKDDGTLIWTTVMLPDAAMPRLLETLAPLATTTARSARDFAELAMNLRPQANQI
jgi:hypothetical protein